MIDIRTVYCNWLNLTLAIEIGKCRGKRRRTYFTVGLVSSPKVREIVGHISLVTHKRSVFLTNCVTKLQALLYTIPCEVTSPSVIKKRLLTIILLGTNNFTKYHALCTFIVNLFSFWPHWQLFLFYFLHELHIDGYAVYESMCSANHYVADTTYHFFAVVKSFILSMQLV